MNNPKFRFWMILSVLWTAVIFGFSAFSRDVSGTQSTAVWEVLRTIWSSLTEEKVRSIAHCLEFAVLGWFTVGMFFHTKSFKLSKPLLYCLFIALCDETLQKFVEGRAPEIKDIWLDFGGAVVSILIFWGFFSMRKSAKK